MKFNSFRRILITSGVVLFLLTMVGLVSLATQSSIGLLNGGVATFPQGTAFVPKQAPTVVSLLVNPEQLYSIRQADLPLPRRQSDRREWQQWSKEIFERVGLDYRQLKPWLGDEVTVAVTALDYDRRLDNGMQPGYLIAVKAKKRKLAGAYLDNFYTPSDPENTYKGAEILTRRDRMTPESKIGSSTIIGDFVLFANQPRILREAIDRAQAVNSNLQHSEDYQTAIAQIQRPYVALAYFDVPQTLSWLKRAETADSDSHLTAWLSIEGNNLALETTVIENNALPSQVYKSLLSNTELGKIIELLPEDNYIDLQANTSLVDKQTPDVIGKLALKELLPHLRAIAIKNLDSEVTRSKIRFKLDS